MHLEKETAMEKKHGKRCQLSVFLTWVDEGEIRISHFRAGSHSGISINE